MTNIQIARAHDRPSSFKLIDKMRVSPALALVDLGLPPNTHRADEGLAVIRKISQMHPSTRILVLSGQDNKKHVLQAREDGAVDFIAKPCDIAEIKVRLKKQIAAGGGVDGAMVISRVLSAPAKKLSCCACRYASSPIHLPRF